MTVDAASGEGRPEAFISISGNDVVDHMSVVVREISAAGWIPRVHGGVVFDDSRRVGLRASRALVVLVGQFDSFIPSREHGGDGQRNLGSFDIEAAESMGIPVLPFLLDTNSKQAMSVAVPASDRERSARFRGELSRRYPCGRLDDPSVAGKSVIAALRALQAQETKQRIVPPSIPSAESFVSVDPLDLAWRLVVDSKADLDLLLHLDLQRVEDAVRKLESETNADSSAGWLARLARAQGRLKEKQSGLEPNALWLAWMRHVHAAKVEALEKPPAPRSDAATKGPAPKQNAATRFGGSSGSS